MNTYRWRAECPVDDQKLLQALPAGEVISYSSARVDPLPDCISELTVRSLSLDELRDIMRRVPDGHVMLQTVQHKELFTGRRNYDQE